MLRMPIVALAVAGDVGVSAVSSWWLWASACGVVATVRPLLRHRVWCAVWCVLNGGAPGVASLLSWGLHVRVVRRCPTLPHPSECSTMGAVGLSFRVRYGSGRFPLAMAAVTLWNYQHFPATRFRGWGGCCSRATQWTRVIFAVSPRPISTSQLHTLRCFHFWPINPVVYPGALPHSRVGVLILEQASRLDAFSGYPFRT